MTAYPRRDHSPHEPVGRVRTGLAHAQDRAFRTGHLRRGSRAFDVLFRFVGGVALGTTLASIARGEALQGVQLINKWPHHPVSDGVALGFLVGIFLAPFALAWFRAKEEFARRTGADQPEFRWVGRRVALVTFAITLIVMFAIGADAVSLRFIHGR